MNYHNKPAPPGAKHGLTALDDSPGDRPGKIGSNPIKATTDY